MKEAPLALLLQWCKKDLDAFFKEIGLPGSSLWRQLGDVDLKPSTVSGIF